MRWLVRTYNDVLRRFPIYTSCAQTGVLMAAGDAIAQVLVERAKEPTKQYNYRRTFQFFCVGAFYVGPVLTVWYRALDRIVTPGAPAYGLKKTVVDQVCMAPCVLAGFLLIVDALQEKSLPEIKKSFRETYPTVLLANYKLWPGAQMINFTFVPLQYQVLYVQCVAVLWNTYLCFKTHADS